MRQYITSAAIERTLARGPMVAATSLVLLVRTPAHHERNRIRYSSRREPPVSDIMHQPMPHLSRAVHSLSISFPIRPEVSGAMLGRLLCPGCRKCI